MRAKLFRVTLAAGVCAATLAGCGVARMGSIQGSGVSMTDERDVAGFTRLNTDGFGDVIVRLGEGEFVTIEGDDNIVPDVETIVRGDALHIGFKRGNYDPELPLLITVGATELSGFDVSGAVDLEAPTLRGPSLDITVSGAASAVIYEVDVTELDVGVSGAADCVISGGRVDVLSVSASGAGTLDAGNVTVRAADVSASGAGDVRIFVSEELDATASGAGTVLYRGEPSVRKRTSGAGSVERAE